MLKLESKSRLILQFLGVALMAMTISSEVRHGRQFTYTKQSQVELMLKFWSCMERAQYEPSDSNIDYCRAGSEGWFCWDSTEAGETAMQPCPVQNREQIPGNVSRRCLTNATWEEDSLTAQPIVHSHSCPLQLLQTEQRNILDSVFTDLRQLDGPAFSHKSASLAFEECVHDVLTSPKPTSKLQFVAPFCQRTFDGWGCWNDTPAGIVAYIPCPTFIPGFSPNQFAYRKCNSDGSWFRHPSTNRTWSNYTTCVDTEDLQFRQQINQLYIVGYFVSVVALTISLFLFFYFRTLSCTRITIHKNLFVSFVINNIFWIVWYSEVVQKPQVPLNNGLPCQILHVVVHYFLMSNYFWMFNEGLYLHTLMVVAFVKEDKIIRWFFLLGWGVPGLLIAIYTAVRGFLQDKTSFCWLEDSSYLWILSGPVILSMLVNFVFLINIVRVLVTKLRAPNSQDNHQIRKAVRATLILIPLLGLHYVITPFHPEAKTVGEAIYEITSAIVTSFQGLCVSMLFCFFNGEVISQLRKKCNLPRRDLDRNKHYCANTTVCCDMQEVTAV